MKYLNISLIYFKHSLTWIQSSIFIYEIVYEYCIKTQTIVDVCSYLNFKKNIDFCFVLRRFQHIS